MVERSDHMFINSINILSGIKSETECKKLKLSVLNNGHGLLRVLKI